MATTNFSQSGAELRIQDGGTYKVGHVGKQPTSLDGGLGSVSRISMATQITQKCHAIWILTMPCGPKRQRSVRQAIMIKTERLGSDCSLDRVVQSITGQ